MRLFKKNNLLLVFLLFLEIAVAQTIPSKNITINDGLPSNGIKCFYKDSRGILWIGTDGGLVAYDGVTYKVYNEANGLQHDKVWSIVEDEDKNLWVSLFGKGLAKYDGIKFTYYNEKDGLVNNSIRKIHYSKKYKCLILATENGLGIFDGKQFKSFLRKNNERFQIVGIDETADNLFITSSYFGVYKLSIKPNIQKSTLESAFTTIVSYSSYISNNTYYSGRFDHNLILKNLLNNKEKIIPCPIIWDYAKDNQNNLYFSTWNVTDPNGGLFKYSNNTLTNISQLANITSTSLWCLFYDKETQQLWVGSNDKGIFRVDLSNRFRIFEPSFFGLKELQIQELFNDTNNNNWIGAKDNIIVLDKDLQYKIFDKTNLQKKIVAYFKNKKSNYDSKSLFASNKLKDGFTSFNIVSDNEGNIWVNNTLGVFCFDKNFNILLFKYFDGGHLVFDNNDQAYYCGMYSDTFLYPNKFDWTKYKIFSINESSVPRDINKIVKDGNLIWFATNSKGLFLLQNGLFSSMNSIGMFKENNITDLIINYEGQLVIGTNNGRVYITKWNGKKLDVLHIYVPNKEIYGTSVSFVEQSNGIYFIGTNKGINVVKNNKFIKLINKSEGIEDIQFNKCVKDKNKNLWVATNNGMIQLNVDEFSKSVKTKNTPIGITSIIVNGKPYLKTDSLIRWGNFEKNKLHLDYTQNDVEITFSSNNTYNANKNIYRYTIVGLSENWSNFESNGRIQLLGIPNGKYKILIEGKNLGTGEFFKPTKFELIIAPPFWKTWWFILISIIALFLIGYFNYNRKIKAVKTEERAKADVQKRLAETKMEALQSQMNPHFIFNAMNSIQNYIIDNNTDDALMYMGEFSKLIRQTLNNSSKQRIALSDEIHYLESYIKIENMRFQNKMKFELVLDDDLDMFDTEIPPMLLQPFIENVFVHAFDSNSKNPSLILSLKQIGNYLYCEIKDNGKGIDTEKTNKINTSKGIKLAKERIALFQHNIENAVTISSSPAGTSVVLKLQVINI